MMTSKEVGERLRVTPRTVHRWAIAGVIPGHRFGRSYKFDPQDIEEYIVRQKVRTTWNREISPAHGSINVSVQPSGKSPTKTKMASLYASLLATPTKQKPGKSSSVCIS
ncbi:MAG: helix-turn-helix domain-containing protein [Rhodobacteraceae bacterium]|nr:helix-turn-helix domain-containing protein [Paracoccaceae bacterium]